MTNREKLQELKKESVRIGDEIKKNNEEEKLAQASKTLSEHELSKVPIDRDLFEVHPDRNNIRVPYYILLYGQFEALKKEEQDAEKQGKSYHQAWLEKEFVVSEAFSKRVIRLAKKIAEKVTYSGIGAGIIWVIGKIFKNWPLGMMILTPSDRDEIR